MLQVVQQEEVKKVGLEAQREMLEEKLVVLLEERVREELEVQKEEQLVILVEVLLQKEWLGEQLVVLQKKEVFRELLVELQEEKVEVLELELHKGEECQGLVDQKVEVM